MSRASSPAFLEMFPVSLKNLALLVFTSALILSGCGGSDPKPPPADDVARKLVFTVQPSQATAGAALAPAVQVTVQSASGKTIPGAQMAVTLALRANPSGGTLSGATQAQPSQGVATFSGLSVDKAGTGYTLVARAEGLEEAVSQAFAIAAGPAHALAFAEEPGELEAGGNFSPGVRVSVRDAFGNPVAAGTAVTLALGANPAQATLSGTLTATTTSAGEALFPELSLDKVGEGYTLIASAQGLEPVASRAFRVKPGRARTLAFSTPPSPATAGQALSPAVQVRLVDAHGNTASGTAANITVALGTNTTGAALEGTATVAAVDGVATFPDLVVGRAGTYTLTASGPGLEDATSQAFDITPGAAVRLSVRVQPLAAVAGAAFTPAVEVAAVDARGNLDVAFSGPVTVALESNPTGDALGGTLTVNADAGVARFEGLSLTRAGAGYTLTASAPGVASGTSLPFDVTAGTAARLAFAGQPSRTEAGAAMAPAVRVRLEDAFGNLAAASTASITLALGENPAEGTLGGTRTQATVDGVAEFANLTLDKAASGYTLVASAQGLAPATSAAFDIGPGTAARLAFRVQPSHVAAGALMAPAVEVVVVDAHGNLVPDASATITLALGTTPGGGPLSGTLEQAATGGVARFDNLSLTRVATGYTLVASASGLTGIGSLPFNVTPGPAAALAITTQPGNVVAATAFSPAVAVTVRDAFGNTVTSSTAPVQLALGNNPGSATLAGTLSVAASNGVATFSGVSVNRVGTGYTLAASSAGLTGDTSTAFNVTAGPARALAFTAQPSNVAAGATVTPAVAVSIVDAGGNPVSTASASVTVAIGRNPGTAILNGTRTVSTVSGVATFSGLSLTRTGEGYTLTASANGLTTGTSDSFNVTPGPATSVSFYRNPPNVITAGQAITPSVQVGVRDAYNNTVTGSTATITVALTTNPGGSTFGGTHTANAVDGVASFPDLTLDRAANNYRLTASSPGLTSNTSALFNVQAGAGVRLGFTTQPANAAAGASLGTVRVAVQDTFGNTVTSGTAIPVSIALGNNPGGATLSGTATVNTSSGVATFSTLNLDRVGTGYTLVASSAPLQGATSAAFNISAGAAARLAFSVPPGNTTAGTAFSPDVQVAVQDAGGNPVTSTASITLRLGNNPGGGTLQGTVVVSAVGGVATFPGVSPTRSGTGYTLTASATGLTTATSPAFDVAPGAPSQLAFAVQPSRAFIGRPLSPAVQVALRDAFGNVSTGASNAITVALGNNPAGATLGGTLTVAASGGVASFEDLALDARGTGFTLTANAEGLPGITSAAFDVVQGGTRLVYTEPATAGRIALMRNPASTDTTVVLDLVALEDLTGYSVGMNLPVEATRVRASATPMVPGAVLPPGTEPVAAYARLPTGGPLAGVLTSGQSQKAAGPGAVTEDSPIPAGSVLYSLRLDLSPESTTGLVFDGAAPGPKFRALLRDKLGTDVVGGSGFAIGRLEVQ